MSTSAKPNPKQTDLSSQSGQAMSATNKPSIEEIKNFDEANLLEWIKENSSLRLKPGAEKKFLDAEIDGEFFLSHAGDDAFFQKAGLSLGMSDKLARLAEKTLSKKSKYCSLHHIRHADSQLIASQSRQASRTKQQLEQSEEYAKASECEHLKM